MTSKVGRRILFAGVAVAVAGGLGGWWVTAARGPNDRLTLADASQPVFALVYVAEARGYFLDEGLDVSFTRFKSGRDALANTLEGKSDVATVFETPVVLRTYDGDALSVLTTLHTSKRNTGIVARKDRGIVKPADLRRRKIGVTKNTNGEFALQRYLASQGIPITDVTLVDTRPGDMAGVLKNGSVDAVATWNPNLYNAQQALRPDEAISFFSDVYTEMSVLAGKRQVVAERKEAMTRLIRAIVRAEQFVRDHEAAALDIVVKRLADEPETTVRAVWKAFRAEAKLDNLLLTILRQEAQWFRETGRYQAPVPDFGAVIFPAYLKAVKPDAVTVF